MQLYSTSMKNGMRDRPMKNLKIDLVERPERPIPRLESARDRVKFIKKVEQIVRGSMEYRDYMKFLKSHMDMKKCTVLKGLQVAQGKRYSIEIHHEPFTLFDIVETLLIYREENKEPISPLWIADEVMSLHYDGAVGLIPLSATMHELVHADEIFIPLQYVYQSYGKFYAEYEDYIGPNVKEKIRVKVEQSLRCPDIISDVLDPEFVYIDIDGFNFPKVPEEWKSVMSMATPKTPKASESDEEEDDES